MDMHLIHIDQDDLAVAHPGEQLQQRVDVGGPLLRLGLAQKLLDLLPRQLRPPQDAADAVAADDQAERLEHPLLELLQRPAVAGQAVLSGEALLDDVSDLLRLRLVKRGARPPVRR